MCLSDCGDQVTDRLGRMPNKRAAPAPHATEARAGARGRRQRVLATEWARCAIEITARPNAPATLPKRGASRLCAPNCLLTAADADFWAPHQPGSTPRLPRLYNTDPSSQTRAVTVRAMHPQADIHKRTCTAVAWFSFPSVPAKRASPSSAAIRAGSDPVSPTH